MKNFNKNYFKKINIGYSCIVNVFCVQYSHIVNNVLKWTNILDI